MNDQEKFIREKRSAEAASKNYLGVTGKFVTIARALGEPIISHASFNDATYLDDFYDLHDEAEYEKTLSGQNGPRIDYEIGEYDGSITHIGLLFDGLRRGMHLEINYISESQKITVFFKGYKVYEEVSGVLESYIPTKEWEALIEKLFKQSKKILKEREKQEQKQNKILSEQRKLSFLERIRLKWGL